MPSIPNCYIKTSKLLQKNISIKTLTSLVYRTLVSHELIVQKCKFKNIKSHFNCILFPTIGFLSFFRIFLPTVNFSKVPKRCILLKLGLKLFLPVCTRGLQTLLPIPLLFAYNLSPAWMVLCTFSQAGHVCVYAPTYTNAYTCNSCNIHMHAQILHFSTQFLCIKIPKVS